MADYSCESADDVKFENLYPVFMKELQNAWNCSAAMDLRKTVIENNKIRMLRVHHGQKWVGYMKNM